MLSCCTRAGFSRPEHRADRGARWRSRHPLGLHSFDPGERGRGRGLMRTEAITYQARTGFTALQYGVCLKGIIWREGLRFLHQRERFVAALVRPLVWLFIFA